MNWHETTDEKLARLRAALAQAQHDLIEAEAEFADQTADMRRFEAEYDARVGHLVDRLAALEQELADYLSRIRERRNEKTFGHGYRPVEEQYRRTWRVPPEAAPKPPEPVSPATEEQIKKLYRQLARRAHPDLATGDADRAYRTDKMQAINDAYAARSMAELLALSAELDRYRPDKTAALGQTDEEMVKVLEAEIGRCRRRIGEIDFELRNLHNSANVQLSLEVKLARRRGRDLLAEMAADLERKIGRKSAELDMIKAQFNSLES
jgi:chromosome segregation ATPase